MPRRIVGSANFDLYASLTVKTEKIFLRLFADIIYKVVDAELRGDLRARGIESDSSRLGKYRLRASIMLADDTIVVRATSFSGPGTEDDEDDRNDDYDICEFEFERGRGQWRLVQVSGIPLPVPDLVNRAASPEPTSHSVPSVPIEIDSRTTIASNVASNFRRLIASAAPYIPNIDILNFDRVTLNLRRKSRLHIFISHSSADCFIQPITRKKTHTPSTHMTLPQFTIQTEAKIAYSILNSLHEALRGKLSINDALWLRTSKAVTDLIRMETALFRKLSHFDPDNKLLTLVLADILRRSPARAEELLFNLVELAAGKSTTLQLRRTNHATWKALIVRPLNRMCDNPEAWRKTKNNNPYYITTHNMRSNAARKSIVVSKSAVSAKATDSGQSHSSK